MGGIETMGGIFTRLIHRNTTIPTKKSQVFSTAADNQTKVGISVLQGEREFAKDKSTGKTQNVTIRSSGGLSDADIDRMVVEAEEAKSDDEAKKRIIDLKNEADQYVYNTEKQLTEHSARLPDSVKDQVRGDISSVNEAIVSEDADKIQEALEKLKNSSMEIGKAIYANTDGDAQSTDNAEEADTTHQTEEQKQAGYEENKKKEDEEAAKKDKKE